MSGSAFLRVLVLAMQLLPSSIRRLSANILTYLLTYLLTYCPLKALLIYFCEMWRWCSCFDLLNETYTYKKITTDLTTKID